MPIHTHTTQLPSPKATTVPLTGEDLSIYRSIIARESGASRATESGIASSSGAFITSASNTAASTATSIPYFSNSSSAEACSMTEFDGHYLGALSNEFTYNTALLIGATQISLVGSDLSIMQSLLSRQRGVSSVTRSGFASGSGANTRASSISNTMPMQSPGSFPIISAAIRTGAVTASGRLASGVFSPQTHIALVTKTPSISATSALKPVCNIQ